MRMSSAIQFHIMELFVCLFSLFLWFAYESFFFFWFRQSVGVSFRGNKMAELSRMEPSLCKILDPPLKTKQLITKYVYLSQELLSKATGNKVIHDSKNSWNNVCFCFLFSSRTRPRSPAVEIFDSFLFVLYETIFHLGMAYRLSPLMVTFIQNRSTKVRFKVYKSLKQTCRQPDFRWL